MIAFASTIRLSNALREKGQSVAGMQSPSGAKASIEACAIAVKASCRVKGLFKLSNEFLYGANDRSIQVFWMQKCLIMRTRRIPLPISVKISKGNEFQ